MKADLAGTSGFGHRLAATLANGLCALLDDAVIDGNTIILTLADGEPDDGNGVADGVIRPSGVAGPLLENAGQAEAGAAAWA